MPRNRSSLTWIAPAFVLALVGAGCTRQARIHRYLARADGYFTAGQYDAAEVEYLNALRLDPQNPDAISRLGLIYADQGRTARAIPFLRKAREVQPNNLDVRLKIGLLDIAAKKPADARAEANFVLERRPGDEDAPLLLAGAAFTPQEIQETRDQLLKLSAAEGAPVLIALATLDLRQGHPAEAETTLRRALLRDPKSSKAYDALAMIEWTQKNRTAAEKAFQQAVALAPARSPIPGQYAQFKLQTGDAKSAQGILTAVTEKTPDYLPAWLQLTQIAIAEKRFEDAAAFLGHVLSRDPTNPDGMLLDGRVAMAKGAYDKAELAFERMENAYPRVPQPAFELGRAYAAAGAIDKAIGSLNQAVTLAPDYPEAVAFLAELRLRKGDAGSAILSLKGLTAKHPELIGARLLLADAFRSQGDLDDALAVYRQSEAAQPANPQLPFLAGLVLLQQQKKAEAGAAFEKALAVAPGYLPAVEQLINLDLADGEFPEALRRAEAEIARNPKSAQPLFLLAKIQLAQNDTAQAEAALKRAIALEPDFPTTYFFLARLYASTHRNAAALTELAQVLAKNPRDVAALMLTAVIREQDKDYPAARDAYERLLTVNPNFGPALNNLAWMYAERFHDLDQAYAMAQKAREQMPQEPHAADTLGWILYQRRQYAWAMSLLDESAARLPDEAEVQYHSGMAHYMMGDEASARVALERALKLQPAFPGAVEARQRLAILNLDVTAASSNALASWEKKLADRNGDPVALARLASLYEREGASDQAIKAWAAAAAANPNNVTALVNQARLEAARGNSAKAKALAEAARKIAPENAAVAYSLGRVVFAAGDYPWALSLLQQAAINRPDDPELLDELGRALYAEGRVTEAEDAMKRALTGGRSFPDADEIRRFLAMVALARDPVHAVRSAPEVEQTLRADPSDVPALMAMATINEQRKNTKAAELNYSGALGRYPNFSPAQRRLAILLATNTADLPKAYDLAIKAHQAFPDDPELAKALGIIVFRRSEYARAASLLQEAAADRTGDAELLFFLGKAQLALGRHTAAIESLNKALALGLEGDRATDAKRSIADGK